MDVHHRQHPARLLPRTLSVYVGIASRSHVLNEKTVDVANSRGRAQRVEERSEVGEKTEVGKLLELRKSGSSRARLYTPRGHSTRYVCF